MNLPRVDFSRREKVAAVSAATVVCVYLLCRTMLFPAWASWWMLSDELSLREAELRKALALAQWREDLIAQWRSIAGKETYSARGDQNAMDLVRDAESWAKRSGVKIIDLRPVRAEAADNLHSTVGVHLSIEGSWPSLVRFLERAQNAGLSVESLHIQRPPDGGPTLYAMLSVEKI